MNAMLSCTQDNSVKIMICVGVDDDGGDDVVVVDVNALCDSPISNVFFYLVGSTTKLLPRTPVCLTNSMIPFLNQSNFTC